MTTLFYTIAFGILRIAGFLLIILGFEILDSSLVAIAATTLPLSFSTGLVFDHAPASGGVQLMVIGLIPYFVVLLATKSILLQQVIDFAVFLMLGVASAKNFANGPAAFRILYGHPKQPTLPNEIAVLAPAFIALWMATILLIIAIYLIGNRKWSGWYCGMTAGLMTLLASGVTHYFRSATNDYLYGALFGLSVVVLLGIPAVQQHLFGTENLLCCKQPFNVSLRAVAKQSPGLLGDCFGGYAASQ